MNSVETHVTVVVGSNLAIRHSIIIINEVWLPVLKKETRIVSQQTFLILWWKYVMLEQNTKLCYGSLCTSTT